MAEFEISGPKDNAVFGRNDATSAPPNDGGVHGTGVFGLTFSPGAAGVFGANNGPKGPANQPSVGVQGNGADAGVSGFSDQGTGVRAHSNHANAVEGFGHDPNGNAMLALHLATTASTATDGSPHGCGILAVTTVPGAAGAFGANNGPKGPPNQPSVGVQGNGADAGVSGFSSEGRGVTGTGGTGVEGHGNHTGVFGTGNQIGVDAGGGSIGLQASSPSGVGIFAHCENFQAEEQLGVPGAVSAGKFGVVAYGDTAGINAFSLHGDAVSGLTLDGVAVVGRTQGTSANSIGVFGIAPTGGAALAGKFQGDVDIEGNLSKRGGGFKIDHPLAPGEKHLHHSFVESPERKNVYDGIAVLDEAGRAVVELPAWFEALNSDFRYQLTCIGDFAPVCISRKLSKNRFVIAGGRAGMEVSWQVTGIRADPWALSHPLIIEELKMRSDADIHALIDARPLNASAAGRFAGIRP